MPATPHCRVFLTPCHARHVRTRSSVGAPQHPVASLVDTVGWQAFGLDPAPLLLAREQAAQQQNNHLTTPPTPDVEGMRSAYASAQGVEPELTNFTACVQPEIPACSPCQQPAACPIMFVPASWWLPMRPSTCMYGRGA
jgi:hypothetical protein